jgi:hypothetical protein
MIKSGQAIYVSIEVWRAMMLIAKEQRPEIGVQRARVADEISDALLDAELIKTDK